MAARGRFRCEVWLDGHRTVLWPVAASEADAVRQLQGDHDRGATLAYKSGDRMEREARIVWDKVETLVFGDVTMVKDYLGG